MKGSRRLSRAHLAALLSCGLAAAALVQDPRLAAVPLEIFVGLCALAPFFPGWRFFLPIITRGPGRRGAIALTFDDGPHPVVTPAVLDLLARLEAPACFFTIGKNVEAHPELVERILAAGHEIGSHSYSHDPLLMLRTAARLEEEVRAGREALAAHGWEPLLFRPPIGITNPRLGPVLARLGMECVCFRFRPSDFGNRRTRDLARRVLSRVKAGDLLLLHDSHLAAGEPLQRWLAEVEALITSLRRRGLEVVALSDLLGVPVMRRLRPGDCDPARNVGHGRVLPLRQGKISAGKVGRHGYARVVGAGGSARGGGGRPGVD